MFLVGGHLLAQRISISGISSSNPVHPVASELYTAGFQCLHSAALGLGLTATHITSRLTETCG